MSALPPTLDLYRALIPAHADVLPETILAWLAVAESRHTRSSWGNVYDSGMVYWAAHGIETTPGTGVGSEEAGVLGPVTSQKDGDLSRTYAAPAAVSSGVAAGGYALTQYGQWYLDLLNSRAETTPMVVGPGLLIAPGMPAEPGFGGFGGFGGWGGGFGGGFNAGWWPR